MSAENSSSWEEEAESEGLAVGDVLADRYRIGEKIGAGGVGVVYDALQEPLERPVAIKVLHDDLVLLRDLRERFEREARILSALVHPHVVSIVDYGIGEGRPFLVMERLEGRTLEELLCSGPPTPERALDLARQILQGLAYAHTQHIAHRDLKPANVFLQRLADGSEHVKLLDFGLGQILAGHGADSGDEAHGLTEVGTVFGTPAYMSPEQAMGGSVGVASDVYSAGILLFELLTGRRPFQAERRSALLRSHMTDALPNVETFRPHLRVRKGLLRLLERATAKEVPDRYRDVGEMLAALDRIDAPIAWLGTPRRGAKKVIGRIYASAALLAVLGGLCGFVAWGLHSQRTDPAQGVDKVSIAKAASPAEPEGGDPWREREVPEPLRPYLERVDRGEVFAERREIRPLFLLAREMHGDARPLLLLGHLFYLKGWYTETLRRYELALRLDLHSSHDPRMLEALVKIAASESTGERAGNILVEAFGRRALPRVAAEVQALEGQALPQLRMVVLRDELSQLP